MLLYGEKTTMFIKTLFVIVSCALLSFGETSSKTKLLGDVIELMHVKETMVNDIKEILFARGGKGQQGLPNSVNDIVEGAGETLVQLLKEDTLLQSKLMSAYSQYFSDQDLQEIVKFLKTPTGQKVILHQADILMKTNEISQEWLKTIQPRITELIMKKLYADPPKKK
jgi:hypothetical protein